MMSTQHAWRILLSITLGAGLAGTLCWWGMPRASGPAERISLPAAKDVVSRERPNRDRGTRQVPKQTPLLVSPERPKQSLHAELAEGYDQWPLRCKQPFALDETVRWTSFGVQLLVVDPNWISGLVSHKDGIAWLYPNRPESGDIDFKGDKLWVQWREEPSGEVACEVHEGVPVRIQVHTDEGTSAAGVEVRANIGGLSAKTDSGGWAVIVLPPGEREFWATGIGVDQPHSTEPVRVSVRPGLEVHLNLETVPAAPAMSRPGSDSTTQRRPARSKPSLRAKLDDQYDALQEDLETSSQRIAALKRLLTKTPPRSSDRSRLLVWLHEEQTLEEDSLARLERLDEVAEGLVEAKRLSSMF